MREILRENWYDLRQWVTYNMWVRMTERILDFWIIFFPCFLPFLWIFILEFGTRLCCAFLISNFHWYLLFFYLILHFVFIPHLFPYLMNPLRAKYGNSFTHPLFRQIIMKIRERERGREGWFFWCERVLWRGTMNSFWDLDETFQNSKWESVSLIHSDILCRPLQMMQDQMGRRKLLT